MSLIVFLALYFLFLWVAWVLAVRLTKPHHEGGRCTGGDVVAWQSFDLRVAQRLNLLGNEHTAKAVRRTAERQTKKLVDPRSTNR